MKQNRKMDPEGIGRVKGIMKTKKAPLCLTALASAVGIAAVCLLTGGDGEAVYRETTVEYGDLVVGVSESGAVDIGTVEQVFELDMSALQRAGASGGSESGGSSRSSGGSGNGGMGGAMQSGLDMFSQIFGMSGDGGSSNDGQDSSLTVSEVVVSAGQQVRAGDVLYILEEESVQKLQEQLQSNVEKAKADLDAVYADQELSKKTAEYTRSSSLAYGDYASTEYAAAVKELENAVEDKELALEKAKKTLAEYAEQLEQAVKDYQAAAEALGNSEYSRDSLDKWDSTYDYVQYFQMAQTALSAVDSLEQKKEQLEANIEQAQDNVNTCERELEAAKRALEQGRLNSDQTQKLRQLAYSTAQETYDIALGYLAEEAWDQEETYAAALENWEEFSSHINGNTVCARSGGIITSVGLEAGDALRTNDTLVTFYNQDEITMTVSVDEDDMADIQAGTQANISLTAYPDQVFAGTVTEISDAETDSYGNVSYQVTATLEGDVAGLFQGMTGEITFITRESEHVLYVSNRAVTRENGRSYVKVRDAGGRVRKQEVKTGFSDGVNVEILEGLSEGDTALIESKVKEE